MAEPGAVVARGTLVAGGATSGTLRSIASLEEVLELMRDERIGELIVFVEGASVSNIAPIVSRVGGVISCGGGPTSHLGIVARGYGKPCVLAAELETDVRQLDGRAVAIEADGSVRLAP